MNVIISPFMSFVCNTFANPQPRAQELGGKHGAYKKTIEGLLEAYLRAAHVDNFAHFFDRFRPHARRGRLTGCRQRPCPDARLLFIKLKNARSQMLTQRNAARLLHACMTRFLHLVLVHWNLFKQADVLRCQSTFTKGLRCCYCRG